MRVGVFWGVMANFIEYNRMVESSSGGVDCSSAGLIEALPDDLFVECLVRVPLQWHANLQRVSSSFRDLVQSREYYELRKAEGTTSSFVCMLQPMPMCGGEAVPEKDFAGRAVCSPDPVHGVSLLDVNEQIWSRLPAVPGLVGGLPTCCRLVAVNGLLVVLGGWWLRTWEPSKSVFVYNFSTQTWRRGADMVNVRNFFDCGAIGNKVFVAGGHDENKKALASVETFDVEANCWESLGSMREERDECTGVVLGDSFLVLSGYGSESQGAFCESAEVYDSRAKSWSFVDNMWPLISTEPAVANPSSLVALAGRLYSIRGKEVVVYSQQQNTWTAVEKVPEDTESGELKSLTITASGNSLIIMGLAKKNDDATFRSMRLLPAQGSCKAQWRTLAGNGQFTSLAQTSCAFEM